MWVKQKVNNYSLKICDEKQSVYNWYYELKSKYIISIVWAGTNWMINVTHKTNKSGLVATHRSYEKDLDIAKFKSLIIAKDLGWDIKSIV
tara:strand:+ start:128 stop:397 length:270 start_codon:yes stop_codon:yes gene_type:complete